MKIVAYSKVPAVTPFVHLGYLSASTTTTKPIQGLLLGGMVLLVAGLAMVGKRFIRRRRPAPTLEANAPRIFRFGLAGSIVLVAGTAAIACAFLFGERDRVFHLPKEATWDHMMMLGHIAAYRSKPGNTAGSVVTLPTQEGDYNLASTLDLPANLRERSTDGWNTPLVLRATLHEGRLAYTVVSAGPDRTWGTQDDITDPNTLIEH